MSSRIRSLVRNQLCATMVCVAFALLASACSDDQESGPTSDVSTEPDTGWDEGIDLGDDTPDGTEEPDAAEEPDASEEPDVAIETFTIDPDRIFDDLRWLAADERAGREPGTPGNDEALDYVETLFEELDLVPMGDEEGSYRQAFEYEQWRGSDTSYVTIDG